jgi:hypothetical protein
VPERYELAQSEKGSRDILSLLSDEMKSRA